MGIFLEAMMKKMGFGAKWILLIMRCISSVLYSILINGQPRDVLKPHRGIRQGDPISPYLFLICAEELSALLNEAENSQEIRGIRIAKEAT